MKTMKIIKIEVSRVLVAKFFQEGCEGCTIIKDALPKDASLVEAEFDYINQCLILYFESATEGTEIAEGQSIKFLKSTLPTFKRKD